MTCVGFFFLHVLQVGSLMCSLQGGIYRGVAALHSSMQRRLHKRCLLTAAMNPFADTGAGVWSNNGPIDILRSVRCA